MKRPQSVDFAVFRTVESLIFAAPVLVAFFQDSLFVFLMAVLVCAILYAFWTRFVKRHLCDEDVESYEAVYDEPPTRVFRLSGLVPWQIWLVWVAVLVYSIVLL